MMSHYTVKKIEDFPFDKNAVDFRVFTKKGNLFPYFAAYFQGFLINLVDDTHSFWRSCVLYFER